MLECVCYRVSIDGANEADVSHVFVDRLFQVSKLCESIDNDTKQDVDHHNDDQDVERAIKHEFYKEQFLVVENNRQGSITDTSTVAEAGVKHLDVALEHGGAEVLIGYLFELVNVEIDVLVLQIEETYGSVDEDDDCSEDGRH
jgi:hypothetical protein